ncbi:uncharacterized protein VP01_5648g1, partial [Puccinia sorghi]
LLPFNGTCGAAAESFVGQILLHTVTYPEQFPTDSSKVAFAILFMTDYTETWSQPYLMAVLNTEEVPFDKFQFKTSFFDHNYHHHAEEFNSHACTFGWANTPLISIYQHRLKESIQLTMVMRKIQFTSLQTMQAMALKAGQKIEGIWNGQLAPIPLAPVPQPRTPMQWTAFQRCGKKNCLSR